MQKVQKELPAVNTTIAVSRALKLVLDDLKRPTDRSMEDVLWRLLKESRRL